MQGSSESNSKVIGQDRNPVGTRLLHILVTSCRANLCAERAIRFLLTESQVELDLRLPLGEVD